MYRTKKINQSIFKSSWVPNLAKCMHVMYENNERYDFKNARRIQKKKCNACESYHKWCMKRLVSQELKKHWIFQSSIGLKESSINRKIFWKFSISRASIGHQSNLAKSFYFKTWTFLVGQGRLSIGRTM